MTDIPTDDIDELDDLPDAVREAEAAVAALAANYSEWVKEDLGQAREALARAQDSAPDNGAAVAAIFGVCHNIKGQGGSFGYDLVTSIGESLCDYIREGEAASEKKLKVIEAHIAAIEFVVENKISGDGGDAGKDLVAKLARFVADTP